MEQLAEPGVTAAGPRLLLQLIVPAVVTLDLVPQPGLQVYPARLHGAACALIEPSWDGDHDAQRKPFSVGPLVGENGVARWRLGWLPDDVPDVEPSVVRFGALACPVLRCDVRTVSFAELASGPPAWSAELDVLSLLYFARNGRDHPLPDPVLIVQSALARWNVFAPAELSVPSDVERELVSTVWLAAFDGRTESAPVTATMHQTGFVGSVRLALTRAAGPVTAGAFAALIRFAEIAGIGAQTTHGFGAIHLRRLNTAPPARGRYRSTAEGSKAARSSQTRSRRSEAITRPSGGSP